MISVKYVGLFSVALIGLQTLRELWQFWCDCKIPVQRVALHFAARALCLIALPVALYLGLFALHLRLLPASGTGDSFMSAPFQASLRGSPAARRTSVLRDVRVGSHIMLRNSAVDCWLHSHAARYPIYPSGNEQGLVSSYQQQVTCFQHVQDENNWWRLEDATLPYNSSESAAAQPRILRHNDLVRLVHVSTAAPLNSHDVAAPMTPHGQEVSCYGPGDERAPAGEPGHMSLNDMWRLELLPGDTGSRDTNDAASLTALHVGLRLVHVATASALQTSGKVLPDWGFSQLEVMASRHRLEVTEAVWTVDDHRHAAAPKDAPLVTRPPLSFWNKLLELHTRMFDANSKLLVRLRAGGDESVPARGAAGRSKRKPGESRRLRHLS